MRTKSWGSEIFLIEFSGVNFLRFPLKNNVVTDDLIFWISTFSKVCQGSLKEETFRPISGSYFNLKNEINCKLEDIRSLFDVFGEKS